MSIIDIMKINGYRNRRDKMERKRNTVIINGRLIDMENAPIEELKKIKRELEEEEKNLKARIYRELAKEDND